MAENQGCLVATNFVSVLAYYYLSAQGKAASCPQLLPNHKLYSSSMGYIQY